MQGKKPFLSFKRGWRNIRKYVVSILGILDLDLEGCKVLGKVRNLLLVSEDIYYYLCYFDMFHCRYVHLVRAVQC